MKSILLPLSASCWFAFAVVADENFDALKREVEELKRRVTALEEDNRTKGPTVNPHLNFGRNA